MTNKEKLDTIFGEHTDRYYHSKLYTRMCGDCIIKSFCKSYDLVEDKNEYCGLIFASFLGAEANG